MKYVRMPIEIESPEQMGYDAIRCNLTESSVSDRVLDTENLNINKLLLCYGHHLGKPELRELIATEHKGISSNQVLLTAGAATALFIVNTTILNQGDEVLVMHPNYGTNIETPRAMGCAVKFIELKWENKFRIDLAEVRSMISPKTRLISITTPHNPTGMVLSESELNALIALAEQHGIYLLVDETYRDIPLAKPGVLAASKSKHVISVSSVSKAFGLPGLRMGWLICQNDNLMEQFLAAKEQINICNSVVDEELTYQFLLQKQFLLEKIGASIQANFSLLKKWLSQQTELDYLLPEGGVVCFPRLKEGIDVEKFYSVLNKKYSTYVGPGHWFEMDKRFMRIGFGWPSYSELEEGLSAISLTLKEI